MQMAKEQPIKYGDVFSVEGELAEKPVTPRDAAMMQTAENIALGETKKGGPASKMQSAATQNVKAGLVGRDDTNSVTDEGGMTVTEADLPRKRVVTEEIAGQVVGQYSKRTPLSQQSVNDMATTPTGSGGGTITIGEALEATVLTAGQKPVEWSDAAAIQAAEVRATGRTTILPGGVAASAQSAATINARTTNHEEKRKLADVLTGAASKLPSDKPVTRKDAEGVTGAEMRNDPNLTTHPAGVSASLAAAARINQQKCQALH